MVGGLDCTSYSIIEAAVPLFLDEMDYVLAKTSGRTSYCL